VRCHRNGSDVDTRCIRRRNALEPQSTLPGNDLVAQRDHLDLLEWSVNLAFDRLAGLKRAVSSGGRR
jgi:hypothetical protein